MWHVQFIFATDTQKQKQKLYLRIDLSELNSYCFLYLIIWYKFVTYK